ncbi:helix-turn-helix transcriptional regulator [Lacibacter sp.]|uniref:helix-turn-helix domain-containing protein n=1 Tax=Lacibacter sp. TaxID=1915409 RepID=UPI002B4B07B5|nr:helix-turn-helix transcriptional regulator [Lacibacter sp.]HLP37014.1 helix-turn-helix transcriptional regulator [Lacibacter sp.]
MKSKEEIIEIEIAEIDLYIINKARELRVARKMSQLKLSIALNLAEGAVSKIENPKQRAKYNIRHINLLAKALKCNPADLVPPKPLKNDVIRAKLKITRNPKDRKGEPNYVVISKVPVKNHD